MGLHYFTQADAEGCVGGAPALREHFKVPNSTSIDQVKLDRVLSLTDGDVRAAIGMSFDLDSFDSLWFNQQIRTTPAPPIPWNDMDKSAVQVNGSMVLCYYIWKEGSQNQAMPEIVKADWKNGKEGLKQLGARLQSLSTQIHPVTSRHYDFRQPAKLGRPPCGSFRRQFRWFT